MARRSTWDGWYPPPSRARPVEGGLRARSQRGAIGASWWSRRFLALLETFGIGTRLERGKRYARQGQVLSLDVQPGAVTARVQGSRARPYRVTIGVARLAEADWRRAEDALVARASFLAGLLAGEMPHDIEEAFAACSLSLFPASADDLQTTCSCPDWANPCKHVAAVYFLLAEAFDDDPFLILRWRGRDRDELLDNLRALRGGEPDAATTPPDDGWADVETVDGRPLDDPDGFWDAGEAVGELGLDPRPPALTDAVLRQLDQLGREVRGVALVELLRPAYTLVTVGARQRLLGGED